MQARDANVPIYWVQYHSLAQPYQSLIIAPQAIIVFLGILQRVHDGGDGSSTLTHWSRNSAGSHSGAAKATAVVERRLKREQVRPLPKGFSASSTFAFQAIGSGFCKRIRACPRIKCEITNE